MKNTISNMPMLIDGRQAYAHDGAVAQDGALKVYHCGKCKSRVVWATSTRTGGKYLVNVFDKKSGGMFYVKNQLHTAESCKNEINETTETAEHINAHFATNRRYALLDATNQEEADIYFIIKQKSADDAIAYLNSLAAKYNLAEI